MRDRAEGAQVSGRSLASARSDAVQVVKKLGSWRRAGPINVFFFDRGTLQIGYRTPFQKMPPESAKFRYLRAQYDVPPTLPYGLDVWHKHRKVLNVEWDDHGKDYVATYVAGDWEDEIKRALAAAP